MQRRLLLENKLIIFAREKIHQPCASYFNSIWRIRKQHCQLDVWSEICIHWESFAFSARSNFKCNVHQYSLDGNISAESFPFLPEIFFVKDCIEEITRFVAAVK